MGKYLDDTGLQHFMSLIKTALSGKQATLVSGTNIKTINNESLLGSGNIDVSGGGSLPSGGMQGAVLAKASANDGDVTWAASVAPFKVYASSPNTSQAFCGFRSLVVGDIPDLSDTYLPLTGCTVNGSVTATGNIIANSTIYAQDAHMDIKRTSLDTTAANNGISADSYLYHGWIDKNSKFSGWCGNIAYTDGRIATQLAARRVNGSTNLDNILVLAVNPNGSRTVTVSDAAPWRSALGLGTAATHNHGDYAPAQHSHSEYFSSTVNRTANTVLAAPNGSNGHASFRSLVLADLPSDVQNKLSCFSSTNSEVYITAFNGLRRLVLTNGNNLRVDTRASTSDEWSNGLYYPGIAPVSETTIANVITQTSTQSSNNPITAAKYYKVNSVSMVEITFKPAAARSAGTAISLGTIVSGKRPHFLASGGSDRITGSITSAGVCNLYARTALTANTAYTVGFTYTT